MQSDSQGIPSGTTDDQLSAVGDNSRHYWLDEVGINAKVDLAKGTPQQRVVLQQYILDPNERHVARELGLSVKTVYNHLLGAQRRLRLPCRVQLMKSVLLSIIISGNDGEPTLGKIPKAKS
jgi:DNA-binding CsgD family transcriptional regulator